MNEKVRRPNTSSYPADNEQHVQKKEYDFSKGKRGALITQVGKTRITIYLDDAILSASRLSRREPGKGIGPAIGALRHSMIQPPAAATTLTSRNSQYLQSSKFDILPQQAETPLEIPSYAERSIR